MKLLVDRGKMADPGDIAGLESFLAKADQLETNFVSVSDTSLAQEKKELAKLREESSLQTDKVEKLYDGYQVEFKANIEKLKQLQQEAQEAKLKNLESK